MTVTYGNCTVLAGDTNVTVPHAYGAVPTSIWVQPRDDLAGRTWRIPDADIGPLTFILYLSTSDTSDHLFRWVAADAEVTAGNAQIAIGATSVIVAHGYGGVPTAVYVTAKDDLAGRDWWVDYAAVGPLTLTIYISTPDLAAHDFRFICGSCADPGDSFVEGDCTVTAGNATVIVNHGFGSTPSCVWVQVKEELFGRQFFIDYTQVTAVQFTLSISTTELTEDFSFRWFCYDEVPPIIPPTATTGEAIPGLYANLYLGDGASGAGMVAARLLTRVDLSWRQNDRRFQPFGSLQTTEILPGKIEWEGRFERGFYTNKYLGSLIVGTCLFVGSLMPVGGTHPVIGGTFVFTSGHLTGMNAKNNYAIVEGQSFIVYNLTFID